MSAKIVQLSLENGIVDFFCPCCGGRILGEEEGIADEPCRHLIAVIDWIDELIVSEHVGEAEAASLHDIHEAALGSVALAEGLPSTAILFELSEPRRGGGHDGGCVTVVVDFAPIQPS